jgi:hypothetical protein
MSLLRPDLTYRLLHRSTYCSVLVPCCLNLGHGRILVINIDSAPGNSLNRLKRPLKAAIDNPSDNDIQPKRIVNWSCSGFPARSLAHMVNSNVPMGVTA